MAKQIQIEVVIDGQVFSGTLSAQHNPESVDSVLSMLPLEGRPMRWGDEFYISLPQTIPEEHATESIDIGTIAVWPAGNAFCIFFGPTPASDGARPVPASPVNVIGTVNDAARLRELDHPSELQVSRRT